MHYFDVYSQQSGSCGVDLHHRVDLLHLLTTESH